MLNDVFSIPYNNNGISSLVREILILFVTLLNVKLTYNSVT